MKRTLVRWGTQFLNSIIMILPSYYGGVPLAFMFFLLELYVTVKNEPRYSKYFYIGGPNSWAV